MMLLENMGEFNLKILIRLIAFIKQCIYSHQIRVSDVASEWAPLLFRNPRISVEAMERVKQMEILLNMHSPRGGANPQIKIQDTQSSGGHNSQKVVKDRKEKEEEMKHSTERKPEISTQSSGAESRKDNNDSERMLCDLVVFLLSNDINLFDDTHIKGAHTLSDIIQFKQ